MTRHADLDPFPEQKSGQNDLIGLEDNLKELLIISTKIIFYIQGSYMGSLLIAGSPLIRILPQ